MARRSLRFLNGLITLTVTAALICTALYAGFALWDNHRIYEEADSVFDEMRAIKARLAAASQVQTAAKATESSGSMTGSADHPAPVAAPEQDTEKTTGSSAIPAAEIKTEPAAAAPASSSAIPEDKDERVAAVTDQPTAADKQDSAAAAAAETGSTPAAAPASATETASTGSGIPENVQATADASVTETALSGGETPGDTVSAKEQTAETAASAAAANPATEFLPANTEEPVIQQDGELTVIASGVSGKIIDASQSPELPAATPVPEPVYEAYGAPFDELIDINPDVNGWLTMAGTAIDYPLVQGATNYTYLNKDVYGNFALSGTIYLDSRNDKAYADPYNLLYGHNMSKHRMFGDVNLYKDAKFFAENREGQLFLKDREHSLLTLSCIVTAASDSVIFNPENWQKMSDKQIAAAIRENALQVNEDGMEILQTKLDNDEQLRILALSTCSSEFTDARTILLTLIDP